MLKFGLIFCQPKFFFRIFEKKKKLWHYIENSYGNTIHKLSAYKCWSCGKWHIGRTPHILTNEDREKYKHRLEEIKKG